MSSAKWRPFCLGLNVLKVKVVFCEVANCLRSLTSRFGQHPYTRIMLADSDKIVCNTDVEDPSFYHGQPNGHMAQ